ncbi:23S rRNA (adenine(2030)-N(6))-methyltransferase RlmJ [Lysobacter sp. A6]|uniref:Ribosomal RNA large subunit methyltransferase J n=1 Tax=Noviluteimonas lactosilytica TaxID=2888523 RepID=A0ABS8JEZ9_9GAMM|nr:23S rRNA (adenine(2030)-N(6))-methyltransferase RlmJ [Lysobacter lactosilyticus]MCC8362100.1 23S rRNA (adenine(2030)-N(6))-methyltransferase RlmJ [Lysobacter lactosilyticus]
MNYRHAFHAGNHADVLKHVALLALCDALRAKPAACFALDTHAGRGLYQLDADAALRTGEAEGGVARLAGARDPGIARYLDAVAACRAAHGPQAYPGSPWLLAHALREQDRIACCELQPEEAAALKEVFRNDPRVAVHARDGYAAMKALLPPRAGEVRFARGLVLIDPPYEAQLEEFDTAIAALRDGLSRWPQATYALWYPIKLRRSLQPFYRTAAALDAKSVLAIELLVRPDDSPLRMNGSGLLILNAPWQFDTQFAPTMRAMRGALEEPAGGDARIEWLRAPA